MVRALAAQVGPLGQDGGRIARAGYKFTEAGTIPDDWHASPLFSVVRVANGQVDPREAPFCDMTLVAPDHIESKTGRLLARVTADEQRAISGKYQFSRGDIVYSKIRPYLRKAILAEFDGLCSADMYPLKPLAGVSAGYVLSVILGEHFSQYAESVSVRSGMPKINRDELSSYWIAMPPTLREQEAIAEAMSDLDALIEAMRALLLKKRAIRHGVQQEFLSGRRRLPQFHAKWQAVTVADVIDRYFCGPSPTCDERNIQSENEWGVLKTTAITWERGWDWTAHKVLPRRLSPLPHLELEVNDVLVTKAGPRHRVGVSAWIDYTPRRLVPSGKMIVLRANPAKAIGGMLSSAIASPATQQFLDQRTTGMAESQVNFENEVLLQAPILMPTVEEQTAIMRAVADAGEDIRAAEARLRKTIQIKQGMMQDLLTGRVRLV